MPVSNLSVTICSWNAKNDLRACLKSLEREKPLEVIVIDNASDDGSPQMVRAEFSWVKLFALDKNLGFGKGHNYAFARANGSFLMPLNSDTIVHEGALAKLVGFMEAHRDIGIAAPKLLNPDGS